MPQNFSFTDFVTLSIRHIKECKSFLQGSRENSSEAERKNWVHSSTDPQTGEIQLRSAAIHPLWRTEVTIYLSVHPSISLSIYWAVCASILPVGFFPSKTFFLFFFLFFLFNLLFLRGTHNQFSWWNVCNTSDWGVHWHFLNTHSIDSTTSLRSALRVQAKRFTDHCSSSHSFKTPTFPWAALFPAALAHTRI